jgi:peptidoglycan/LPS O-acetylase OafA/YrhL
MAETTPASRERVVDLLRAVAIILVVLGHWLVTVVDYDPAGRLTGQSALPELAWAYPLTWIVQVIPVFFLVGGYANAASLTASRERGGDATGWLQERSGRLVRPTSVLLVTMVVCATGASAADVPPELVRRVVWFAAIPLWFLAAYLTVVLLAPVMHRLHRRYGLAVPAVLVVLVGLGDLARLADVPRIGAANFVFGWLAIHQMGFAWRDGRLPAGPRLGLPLLIAGLAVAAVLTGPGPYPVTMVDVAGLRPHNMSPPTVALLALATAQLGLILLVRRSAERWLQRRLPWTAVVAVNAVILTVFLWHISAAALVAGALGALGLLPTPPVGSTDWWLWRIPWLLLLTLALVGLVAVFGRFEARSRSAPDRRPDPAVLREPAPRFALTVGGYLAIILALLDNGMTRREAPEPLGLPLVALVAYLVGAGTLRLLRSTEARAEVRANRR